MEYTGRCVAVSEPNSLIVLAEKIMKFGDSPELRQLSRDIIRWECRPYPTTQPPPLGYCLKLMRYGNAILPIFRQHPSFCYYLFNFQLCVVYGFI